MKDVKLAVSLFGLLFFSCSDSRVKYAIKWTEEIKAKIIEDSGKAPDSTFIENPHPGLNIISTFKNGALLKSIRINPETKDTLGTIYYSTDQNFILGRELCPLLKDHYVEVIFYKKMTLGEHTFYYCNGKIKKQGLNIHGLVGVWKEYDQQGKLVKITDYGNIEKLDTLKEIKYYR
jgi:hypothetical protein